MIDFKKKVLENGLKVIVHRDVSTPMAVVNVLYDAGSRDDDPERTGTAHLLEHLMFGGTAGIPSFDMQVQRAAGENNAFTSNDITNYHITLPAANLETGLWLESDRMLNLEITPEGLDIQKSVVAEEFRQRYINQPYGDIWMILRPLAYKIHPYRWPVIGSDISHTDKITLIDIKQFYGRHYCPSKAILTIVSGHEEDQSLELAEKWFGTLKRRSSFTRSLPAEPPREQIRQKTVYRDVPSDHIAIAYNMCGRFSAGYHAADLISDLLAGGRSSRLYRQLVMDKKVLSSVNAFITGDIDPGLFVIQGMVSETTGIELAYDAIMEAVGNIISGQPDTTEMDKVKNKLEATRHYTHTDILTRAADLAYYELLGDAEYMNEEISAYRETGIDDIAEQAASLFRPENSSVLFYRSEHKSKNRRVETE